MTKETRYFADWYGPAVVFAEDIDRDEDLIKAFKKAYDEAVKNGEEVYTFMGHDVLTAYAKYVLEYLEMKNARAD